MGCDKSLYFTWRLAPSSDRPGVKILHVESVLYRHQSQFSTGDAGFFVWQCLGGGKVWVAIIPDDHVYIYIIFIYICNINVIFAWTSTLPIWLPGLNKLHESLGTFVRYSLFLPYWVSHQPMNLVQIGRSHAVNTPKILQGCNGLKMFQSFCGNHLWNKNDTNYH